MTSFVNSNPHIYRSSFTTGSIFVTYYKYSTIFSNLSQKRSIGKIAEKWGIICQKSKDYVDEVIKQGNIIINKSNF